MMELPTPQPPAHRIIAADEVLRAMGVMPRAAAPKPVPDPRPVDPRAPTYSVVTTSSPPQGGIGMGDGTYVSGATVTIHATPDLHYTFVNWTYSNGLVASTDDTYTFVINANTTLIANFAFQPIEYPAGVPWNIFRQMVGHMNAANASRDTIDTYDKAQAPTALETPAASDAKLVGRENQDELAPPPPPHTEPGH